MRSLDGSVPNQRDGVVVVIGVLVISGKLSLFQHPMNKDMRVLCPHRWRSLGRAIGLLAPSGPGDRGGEGWGEGHTHEVKPPIVRTRRFETQRAPRTQRKSTIANTR